MSDRDKIHPVVEAAALAMAKRQAIDWEECDEDERDEFRFDAKAALQAIEPLLAKACVQAMACAFPEDYQGNDKTEDRLVQLAVAYSLSEASRRNLRASLKALVSGLDETNWSSWQTTAKFSEALDYARALIAAGAEHDAEPSLMEEMLAALILAEEQLRKNKLVYGPEYAKITAVITKAKASP